MASEKPGPGGLEPQPVGLIAVGAGGGGGGGSGGSGMGEAKGASASGAVVLPAGMINPSVPIRNIRMKFAVLIGLIQVGEVSNRDIVETVLNLVREKACCLPPSPHSLPAPQGHCAAHPCEPRSSSRCCRRVTCQRVALATPPPRSPLVLSCHLSAVSNLMNSKSFLALQVLGRLETLFAGEEASLSLEFFLLHC